MNVVTLLSNSVHDVITPNPGESSYSVVAGPPAFGESAEAEPTCLRDAEG